MSDAISFACFAADNIRVDDVPGNMPIYNGTDIRAVFDALLESVERANANAAAFAVTMTEHRAEVERLQARLAAAERDAARYRWLRAGQREGRGWLI